MFSNLGPLYLPTKLQYKYIIFDLFSDVIKAIMFKAIILTISYQMSIIQRTFSREHLELLNKNVVVEFIIVLPM